MANKVLELKDWYSINNVCTKLECEVEEIAWLINKGLLSVYGDLHKERLLAYKNLRNDGGFYYAGKAQVLYSGKVKLNSFDSSLFIKRKTLTTNSVNIVSESGLEVISEDDIFDSWIYESHINKWRFFENDDRYLDFEYCLFPRKESSNAKRLADLAEPFLRALNSDGEPGEFMKQYRKDFSQYIVNTNLTFDESSIVFKAFDINKLSSSKSRRIEKVEKLEWYNSFKNKNPFKKIINIAYKQYPQLTSKELWEVIKDDSEADMALDPDCRIEEVGYDYIYLLGSKPKTFKTFENYLSKCRTFYSR